MSESWHLVNPTSAKLVLYFMNLSLTDFYRDFSGAAAERFLVCMHLKLPKVLSNLIK